jgi:protein-S-isoprenylcysteine O-methyltransferase Ste14
MIEAHSLFQRGIGRVDGHLPASTFLTPQTVLWTRYTRHPNYLGDVISFTGLCLISGRWLTGLIPLIMLAGFIFANIPLLDSHLHEHYGAEFDQYATRTRKLIPFFY